MDHNYTKRAKEERRAPIAYSNCLVTINRMKDSELSELITRLEIALAKLHKRYVWKRDLLQCQVGTAKLLRFERMEK